MTITDLDLIDPDINDLTIWVVCEDCGDSGPALDMHRDTYTGAWLCWSCDHRARTEYDEQRAYLDSIRYI